jgi:hypothetical protein
MLKFLSGYGIDHHSRAIVDLMPFLLEKELPSIIPYLASRLKQTEQVKKITRGCVRDDFTGVAEMSLWLGGGIKQFEEKVMKKAGTGKKETQIDKPIRV